jgi:hypothetical protein
VWTLNIEARIGSYSPFKCVLSIPYIDKIPNYTKISKHINSQLSRDASRILFKFNVIENNVTRYPEYIPLCWRTSNLPTSCNLGTQPNPGQSRREYYVSRLPTCFMYQFSRNLAFVTLPKKTNRDVFLFFTFKESDFLYFIPFFDTMQTFDKIDINPFTFPFEGFYLSIKYEVSNYEDSEGISYKVKPNSWDNVYIEKIT